MSDRPMTSHHDKGQLFGTDGRESWIEPELAIDAYVALPIAQRAEWLKTSGISTEDFERLAMLEATGIIP